MGAPGKDAGFGLGSWARARWRGEAEGEEGRGGEVWDGSWAPVRGWPKGGPGRSPGSSPGCALGQTPWECPGLAAPGWHWWRACQR